MVNNGRQLQRRLFVSERLDAMVGAGKASTVTGVSVHSRRWLRLRYLLYCRNFKPRITSVHSSPGGANDIEIDGSFFAEIGDCVMVTIQCKLSRSSLDFFLVDPFVADLTRRRPTWGLGISWSQRFSIFH
eukprot:m.275456 g.275456  ORF g.275456 m.275456 type:complete len:130 (+) comp16137_c0_seq11:484-873(+)